MHDGFDVSFENLHKIHKKCTQCQIMFYQLALNLNKTPGDRELQLSFETVTVLDQIICTRKQINFQIFKHCASKIGVNTTAKNFYPLNTKISLNMLNLELVPYKRMAKTQFLKYGKT